MFSQSTEQSQVKWVMLPRPKRLKGTFASIVLQNIQGHDDWHTLKAPAFYGPKNEWKGVSEESPQTSDELRIISLNSQEIECELEDCSVLTEFGPGDGTKTMEILKLVKNIKLYRMVDEDESAMWKLAARITKLYPRLYIECWQGPFESAPSYATNNRLHLGHALSLGSTLFNNSPEVNNKLMRDLAPITNKIIIGQDGNTDEHSVRSSYTTPAFHNFIEKGRGRLDEMLNSIDRNPRRQVLKNEGWQSNVRIVHEPAFHVVWQLAATKTMDFIFHEDSPGEQKRVRIKKNTELNIFKAYKYNQQSIDVMAAQAGYDRSATYVAPKTGSCLHILVPLRDDMVTRVTTVEDIDVQHPRRLKIETLHLSF